MKIITSIYAFFLVLFSILINIRVVSTAAPVFVVVLSFVITALAIVILCVTLKQLYLNWSPKHSDDMDYDDGDGDYEPDCFFDGVEWIIIQFNGMPTRFSDGRVIVYGDYSDAQGDLFEDDLGLVKVVYYKMSNGEYKAELYFGDEQYLGGFTYTEDEFDTNYQRQLNSFFFDANLKKYKSDKAVKEDIRHQISAYLMHTSDSKRLVMDVIIGEDEAVGLSTLEMPHVTSGFQDNEGIIWFTIYGYSEPIEFDTLTVSDVKNILEFFKNR